ncbi:hypothetical protein ACQKWADRAFT_162068 [Trichoderma austrokoningii]
MQLLGQQREAQWTRRGQCKLSSFFLFVSLFLFSFLLPQVGCARRRKGAASWLTGDTDARGYNGVCVFLAWAGCTLIGVGGVFGAARAAIRRLASASIPSALLVHAFYALYIVYYESCLSFISPLYK